MKLKQAIKEFVNYHDHRRYHKALDNLTPADIYPGREKEVLTKREAVERRTMRERRRHNLQPATV